jgi:hypothetical protein
MEHIRKTGTAFAFRDPRPIFDADIRVPRYPGGIAFDIAVTPR